MQKTTFKISGMHCASCSKLIEMRLEEIGVKNSKVDLASGKAQVEFDPNVLDQSKIEDKIKSLGYTATKE